MLICYFLSLCCQRHDLFLSKSNLIFHIVLITLRPHEPFAISFLIFPFLIETVDFELKNLISEFVKLNFGIKSVDIGSESIDFALCFTDFIFYFVRYA